MILKRVSNGDEERPLLKVTNQAQAIQESLRFRRPFYERAADFKVNTSRMDIDSVAEQIVSKVKQDANFSL